MRQGITEWLASRTRPACVSGPFGVLVTLVMVAGVAVAGCLGEPLETPLLPQWIHEVFELQACACAEECVDFPFDNYDPCAMRVGPIMEDAIARSEQAGLRYAESCAQTLFSVDCPNLESGGFLPCEDDCQIYYGEQPEGAACEAYGHRMSDCAQGLVCGADRVCHQPCEIPFIAPEGGFCGAARGMWFVQCDAGLSCNAEGLCEAAQPLGGPCSEDVDCAIGGWCDASVGACAGDYAGGTACERHEQCTSDVCKAGACFEPESPECGRWAW
jgi:hypothetical protein